MKWLFELFSRNEQIIGFNAPDADRLLDPKNVMMALSLKPQALRFPGGTNSTNASEIGDVPAMAAIAKELKIPVLWVANLYTGSLDKCLWSLQTFLDKDVSVKVVTLGNEPYLSKYSDVWSTPSDYMRICDKFSNGIAKEFPDLKLAVNIPPSNAMKDPDSSNMGMQRLKQWREQLMSCQWADYYEIHSYANIGQEKEHRSALDAYVMSLDKQVIIGEFSVHQNGTTVETFINAKIQHHHSMLEWLSNRKKQVPIAIAHNLISESPNGYNAIRARRTGVGKPMELTFTEFGRSIVG